MAEKFNARINHFSRTTTFEYHLINQGGAKLTLDKALCLLYYNSLIALKTNKNIILFAFKEAIPNKLQVHHHCHSPKVRVKTYE